MTDAERIAALEQRIARLEQRLDPPKYPAPQQYPPPQLAPVPVGCICPMGAERVCRAALCPRQPWVVS